MKEYYRSSLLIHQRIFFAFAKSYRNFIFIILLLSSFAPIARAQYQLEKLDRGVVAVSMGGSKVFVSWRWLGTEDVITFNLYRNGVKINASPLTVANYTDNAGSTTATYTVTAIVNGVEQPASAGVKPWAQQYLKVPIQAPPAGTTPTGEAYTYNANDASIADLDGDGQWEIILKWDPSNAKDNSQSGYTGNTYIDAYKMNGTRLWRIDFGRNIRAGAHYLDFMVYDFDGDGKAEMMARTAEATIDGTGVVIGNANADYRTSAGYILTGPEYITVFNGQTGKAMATNNLYPPRGVVADWGDSYGNRVDRFKACVAYLDGQRPSAVFTRGYYAKWGAEAIDWRNGKLTQRWTFMVPNNSSDPNYSEGAHSLSVADVDGDGKQEVITGSLILDDNGTVYYNTNIGHGDALHVSDLDPDLPGIEISHIQEPVGNAGLYMYSGKTKNVIWRKPTAFVDANGDGKNDNTEGPGRGVCADISAATRGAESWCSGGGIPGVFDCKGNLTNLATPQSCNFLAWWDGDVLRELLNNTMIDKFGTGRLLTAYNIAPIASNNGTKSTPCLSGDIIGDWREEVIWRAAANDALYIFTTTTPSTNTFRTLMHDPQYRVAIAWQNTGYNQPPHLSYYLGDGMATPAKPNIVVIDPANSCQATINTTTPLTFCQGGSVVLTASTGSTYKWFNGTTQVGTASTYTANATGTYTVQVTTASGCSATSAPTTVTVNTLPTAVITSPATSFCTGGSVILSASTGTGLTYQWSNAAGTIAGATAATYSATAAGNYTVKVTNASSCSATSAATVITVNTLPTVSITTPPSTSFCSGSSITLSATTATGLSYQWSNAAGTITGATASSYTATTAGVYTVKATNSNKCSANSGTVTLVMNPLPTATITSTGTSFCAGGSMLLSANTGTGLTYQWSNAAGAITGATGATYTATAANAYTVKVTNNNSCSATSAVTQIGVSNPPTAAITSTTTSLCAGGSLLLSANTGTGLTYQWSNTAGIISGATAATYTATAAGGYAVKVTNSGSCSATSGVTQISVSAAPTATITSTSTSFCAGGSVLLSANTGAGLTYQWSNTAGTISGATAATYSATAAGGYSVKITNSSSCSATSSVTQISVAAAPTATITSTGTSFCTGGSVILSANTGAGLTYQWSNTAGTISGATAATYTATAAGGYSVKVTNSGSCSATSSVTQISVAAAPTATITSTSTSFCAGGSVLLSTNIGTGLTYQWSNTAGTISGATAATYTATAAGGYSVKVTNSSSCSATSNVTQISVSAAPTATITSSAASFCTGSSIVLSANSGSGLTYQWSNTSGTIAGATAATYTATAAGGYSVKVTNGNFCSAMSSVTQISVSTGTVWYADTDGDGKGDPAVGQTSCTQPIGYVSAAGDACPTDANKIVPGTCGCGQTETDTDSDGTADCIDSDDDNDGVLDTNDCQPLNAAVTTATNWYQDTDGDGKGDPSSSLFACTQPAGYVSTADDTCPSDPEKTTPGNCGCGNKESSCLDCAGTPNGTAVVDNCNICTGGTTGKTACVTTATINGTTANITVTPQPFDNTTTIKLTNYGNIQSITIISSAGALVDYKGGINNTEITLGDSLAAGLYSVIIQTENGVYTTKIVKK